MWDMLFLCGRIRRFDGDFISAVFLLKVLENVSDKWWPKCALGDALEDGGYLPQKRN